MKKGGSALLFAKENNGQESPRGSLQVSRRKRYYSGRAEIVYQSQSSALRVSRRTWQRFLLTNRKACFP